MGQGGIALKESRWPEGGEMGLTEGKKRLNRRNGVGIVLQVKEEGDRRVWPLYLPAGTTSEVHLDLS